MPEEDTTNKTNIIPATVDSLIDDFHALGIKDGMTVLVHSSPSKMGWVVGGPVAVLLALEQVLGDSGTLVMPTFTSDNSEPSDWKNPPVPNDWWQIIRDHTPAFDEAATPAQRMGKIAETFRTMPGTLRSTHPQGSFGARGPNAELVVNDHSLEYSLGEKSPVARIYDLDGYVLLVGVDHDRNSSLHLAEYRVNFPGKKMMKRFSAAMADGVRKWVEFDDIETNETDFILIGRSFEKETGELKRGKVGMADCMFFSQRALVDYAVKWMEENRR